MAPVLAAAAVVTESQAEDKPAVNNANTLRLMGMKKNSTQPYNDRSAIMFLGPSTPNYVVDENTHVSMAVGRDDLWLKSADGNWKRVVTE
jgi:hypothetical protein